MAKALILNQRTSLARPECTVSRRLICGRSLRFIYEVKTLCSDFFEGFGVRTPTLNIASGAHKLVQIPGGDFFCGSDTVAVAMRFAMKRWPNLLITAEIPCDFVCDSKKRLRLQSDAVVHLALGCCFAPPSCW